MLTITYKYDAKDFFGNPSFRMDECRYPGRKILLKTLNAFGKDAFSAIDLAYEDHTLVVYWENLAECNNQVVTIKKVNHWNSYETPIKKSFAAFRKEVL